MIRCTECNVEFLNKASLQAHKSKFKPVFEGGVALCKLKLIKKEEKKKRKHEEWLEKQNTRSKIKAADPAQLCSALEKQETTNNLLQQLTTQVSEQSKKIDEQSRAMHFQTLKMEKLSQQNDELKDMMVDLQNNPQLVLVCNQLYPLNTLRELDLGEPRFEPVRQILDTELPEYANLASKPTATVHCKAVKQLNMVHPTAVQDGEQIFYKDNNIMSKDTNHETTRAFIEAIANSGYEYAKKARKDLTRNLESDSVFKEQVLENASCECIPKIYELGKESFRTIE
jgi:hypothetical protein